MQFIWNSDKTKQKTEKYRNLENRLWLITNLNKDRQIASFVSVFQRLNTSVRKEK